ncbi:MAG TPA: YdiU family protein [Methylophilaceae bacterium]|nr:YdiU family protein [Methylophilaceae bacterium]
MMLNFDNRFVRDLPGDPDSTNHTRHVHGAFWSPVTPTPVSAPELIAYSPEMASMLDLDDKAMHAPEMVNALAGNDLLPGMQTYATCYGGHQFGNWAGQLGDGRAIFLGEVKNSKGQRWEMQLKGAGPTQYSRRADGRAVLRSSIREFLCSEAMHHLGIPTTRALSLVLTGDEVMRDMFYNGNPRSEPGAIVCRVAPSFIRFGHFEIFASRGELALLQQLVDFTIARDFPEIEAAADNRLAVWFIEICERTARLLAHWMRVGFVHGVMNTDNMSILGLTIDYGPYGWIDNFDPGWTPNTTDASGRRYCFGRQPDIARWNLERLAEALYQLQPDRAIFDEGLNRFDEVYGAEWSRILAAKFGFAAWQDDVELASAAFDLMYKAEVDMTDFFRQLAKVEIAAPDVQTLRSAFYKEESWAEYQPELAAWLELYAQRIRQDKLSAQERIQRMNQANPRYVLRNYLAQQAIDLAEAGDYSMIHELLDVMRHPYDEQPGKEIFAAKRPDWARQKAGCSMLSCSS